MVGCITIGVLLIFLEYVLPFVGILKEYVARQQRAPYQKEYARTAYYLRGSWFEILNVTYKSCGRFGRTPIYEVVELKDLGNGCFKSLHNHIRLSQYSYRFYREWYARASYDYVTAEIKQLIG